jgi:hypothetical protein
MRWVTLNKHANMGHGRCRSSMDRWRLYLDHCKISYIISTCKINGNEAALLISSIKYVTYLSEDSSILYMQPRICV